MSKDLKIVLYILGEKGYSVLNAINQVYSSEIFETVIYAEDKNIQDDFSSQIIKYCELYGIKYANKISCALVSSESYKFAIGWRWIINDIKNLIILHDSILPRYRGFAPLVSALINGDTKIGVSAIYASSEFDRGDILLQKTTEISYPIKINCAIKKMAELYVDCVLSIIKSIQNNQLRPIPQNDLLATYSLWRTDKDYYINWKLPANKIKRFIDAVGHPYAGAKAFIENDSAIIFDAEVVDDNVFIEDRELHIGKVVFVLDEYPVVICGEGLLKISSMQNMLGNNLLPLKKFRTLFY